MFLASPSGSPVVEFPSGAVLGVARRPWILRASVRASPVICAGAPDEESAAILRVTNLI